MSLAEVRTRFHALIEEVESPSLLLRFFEIMKQNAKPARKKMWQELSESQKDEVLAAYEESKEEKNLISNEAVMKRHAKWLKR